jgi:nicotinamide phosphoribosyltransferase
MERLSSTAENPLLALDVYKMGHMRQYKPGVTKVFSYLTTRSDKRFDKMVFFGLQYYLKKYLSIPLEPWMAEEFIQVSEEILGTKVSFDVEEKIHKLCTLGYWPLEIRAINEGIVLPVKNVVMTIINTLPEYYWCVGFVESLLLKVWYTSTVASMSLKYRETLHNYMQLSSDAPVDFEKFMVHDFGYRGDHCEESAAISGVAHLTSFVGSDTVPALNCAKKYYAGNTGIKLPIMASVPASEHSVMSSFGRENELDGFKHMLKTYPTGIVSIVSDTYSIWDVLTKHAVALKDDILARDGKVVFRPDSGDPEKILCGDIDADPHSPEGKGVIQLLDEIFGHTVNLKGYKVLNPKIGVIYGDGMYFERWQRIIQRLVDMGYSAENLVIGIGGILRNFTRDDLGFALKATYVEFGGNGQNIMKDPVTDPDKKSHSGIVGLFVDEKGQMTTTDQLTWDEYNSAFNWLTLKFLNGKLANETSLTDVRNFIDDYMQD